VHWWDIYIQVPEGAAEAVSLYLQHLGSAGTVLHDQSVLALSTEPGITAAPPGAGWTVVYGALSVDDTFLTRVCALQQFLDAGIEGAAMPRWKLACRPLETLDYLTQWQRFFHPITIGERLVIHPPWETPVAPASMQTLVLDPSVAFGPQHTYVSCSAGPLPDSSAVWHHP
jgi:ribosomal protein L11 methyltransferase